MGIGNDLRKYLNYIVDTGSFIPNSGARAVSERALEVSRSIRGAGRGPALIIHGIMPRSGTVYVGELLRRHPDLHAYPNRVWEMPFLQHTDHILRMQRDFFRTYEQNVAKIGERDFLPLFGAAFIAYLHAFAPDGKRILLKVPGVQHLDGFFAVFPHEHLLVLLRDGRDVVHSTRKTWPQITFGMACRRWKRSARMVLACRQRFQSQPSSGSSTSPALEETGLAQDQPGSGSSGQHRREQAVLGDQFWVARFEDAVRDPAAFVREACRRFDLDEDAYPFDGIDRLPVHGSTSLGERGAVDWAPVEKPSGFSPIGHWRRWSWLQRSTFKRIAGRELIELGYCDDLDW
jgi:protein-tyrosine sulfotransferase